MKRPPVYIWFLGRLCHARVIYEPSETIDGFEFSPAYEWVDQLTDVETQMPVDVTVQGCFTDEFDSPLVSVLEQDDLHLQREVEQAVSGTLRQREKLSQITFYNVDSFRLNPLRGLL